MKRVYLIFTLFITSFFLLSSNVSADTTIYEVNLEEVDYLLTDEFIELRKQTIEFCNENNKYYVIVFNGYNFTSHILDKVDLYVAPFRNEIYIAPVVSGEKYELKTGILTKVGSFYQERDLFKNSIFTYINYLDTNIENIPSNVSTSFIIQYNDVQYTINPGDHLPTLYELYLDNNVVEEETNPKLELISNFYILVIDKIKLFADFIATNYIILSSLVIFIFVSAIDLVRRFR